MTHYDEHEPLELERLELGPAEVAELAGVPIAVDGCTFTGCDLSALRFYGVKSTRFQGSKLRGTAFAKHVRSVTFEDCQLTECRFRMTVLKQVAFKACQLVECDFYGSELTELSFPASDFEGVGFDACTLDRVDMSEASMLLVGDPRTMKGATVNSTQVPLLAHRLAVLSGINVVD